MYCRHCGAPVSEAAASCGRCGNALPSPLPVSVVVPSYLAPAILVTLFCCVPFGIPAIVFAAQVHGRTGSGDLAGAQLASQRAKFWCWMAFGIGLPAQLAFVVLYAIGAIAGAAR